jgi:putative ABC transport system permease protein
MTVRDVLAAAAIGLRSRRMRAALSALGISIGIASIVAVIGISGSTQANLLAEIDALGTNLLTVAPGQQALGGAAVLPPSAPAKIGHLESVQRAAAVYDVTSGTVLRSNFIDVLNTGGLGVMAADPGLLATLRGSLAAGTFLTQATARYPAVVLGSTAARQLGITSLARHPLVYISGHWFAVVGVMRHLPLAPELDVEALIGLPIAERTFGVTPAASKIYVRTDAEAVTAVRDLLPASANPEHPSNVQISRPSDALAARAAAQGSYDTLLLGLGAIALLVGGVGIANVMVISVIERRGEIGLRRAVGATRRDIGAQFLTEAMLLSLLGGIGGAAVGAAATAAYAWAKTLPAAISLASVGAGVLAAVAIGAVAGLYPALRAARMMPTEALHAV